jgi:hypothetical protein
MSGPERKGQDARVTRTPHRFGLNHRGHRGHRGGINCFCSPPLCPRCPLWFNSGRRRSQARMDADLHR